MNDVQHEIAFASRRHSARIGNGGSSIPVESLDRAMWRLLKAKRHLTASVPLHTNWRTAIGSLPKLCGSAWTRQAARKAGPKETPAFAHELSEPDQKMAAQKQAVQSPQPAHHRTGRTTIADTLAVRLSTDCAGAGDRDRTGDIQLGKPALN